MQHIFSGHDTQMNGYNPHNKNTPSQLLVPGIVFAGEVNRAAQKIVGLDVQLFSYTFREACIIGSSD